MSMEGPLREIDADHLVQIAVEVIGGTAAKKATRRGQNWERMQLGGSGMVRGW